VIEGPYLSYDYVILTGTLWLPLSHLFGYMPTSKPLCRYETSESEQVEILAPGLITKSNALPQSLRVSLTVWTYFIHAIAGILTPE